MLAIVIVSVNSSGSIFCCASSCQLANNCMGFSGASAINERSDASITSRFRFLSPMCVNYSFSFKQFAYLIKCLHYNYIVFFLLHRQFIVRACLNYSIRFIWIIIERTRKDIHISLQLSTKSNVRRFASRN